MDWVESAAFSILTPVGSTLDPADRPGLASFVCEMSTRGSGQLAKRPFMDRLDFLGLDRGESVSELATTFSGATIGQSLPEVLGIYAAVLRDAHLPEEEREAAEQTLLQEVYAAEDDPQHKVIMRLREKYYGDPLGRPPHGTEAGITATTLDEIRSHYARYYRPNGTIIGVAGRFSWDMLRAQVEELFGDWEPATEASTTPSRERPKYYHEAADSHQTHVAVALPSLPYRHPDFFLAGTAVSVLSGGMSSRLFTEIREKRGLCYSVYASHQSFRDLASIQCYAGTRPERAQETLDVLLEELVRLSDGVTESELDRVKAQYKSSLVMQQESSYGRSLSLVRDWFHLGRIRTMEEIQDKIDGLSTESLNAFLKANPCQDWTIVTLGPEPLKVN